MKLGRERKDDLIIPLIFIVIYLLFLRNYLTSPPYIMVDTAIVGISNPGIYAPEATILYYLSLLLGQNTLIKLLNFLAFVIGPISIYFIFRNEKSIIKKFILPLIYTLNPFAFSIFKSGDGESILLVYSLQPIVFYLTYKLYQSKEPVKYLIYLSIVEVIGQIFFFQMFLFSFFYQLPIILLSIKDKRYKIAFYPIIADSIGFLSEISQEILLYILVVPGILPSSANTQVSLGLFYYSQVISVLLLAIGVITLATYKNKVSAAILTSLGFLLSIYAFIIYFHGVNIPIISALLASFTTFQTKVFLLSFGLLDLSLFFVRKYSRLIISTLFLIIIVLLPNTGFLSVTIYSFFGIKPTPIPSWYYELYDYLANNNPYYVYANTSIMYYNSLVYYVELLPGFNGFINLNFTPFDAVKFLISISELNYSWLKFEGKFGPFYLYYNQNYTGLVHYLNGTPVNGYTISESQIIVNTNKTVIVSVPYSIFWTNAKPYHGFIELTGGKSYNTLVDLKYILYFISVIFFILPFLLLIFNRYNILSF
ncbi:MAG: hypothetical protein QXQ01_07000 [Saccharolobus sp.]